MPTSSNLKQPREKRKKKKKIAEGLGRHSPKATKHPYHRRMIHDQVIKYPWDTPNVHDPLGKGISSREGYEDRRSNGPALEGKRNTLIEDALDEAISKAETLK